MPIPIWRLASLLGLAALPILIGCGFQVNSPGVCTAGNLAPLQFGTPNFTLVPQDNDFTIYPGQTKTLAVAIQPIGNATGLVSIHGGTLQGITVVPATGNIGSTVNVSVTASVDVVSNCFVGELNVFTATQPLTLTGQSTVGTLKQPIAMTVVLENPAYTPVKTVLPVFTITTTGAAPVTSKDDYVTATLVVTNAAKKSYDITQTMGIKVHGNTTAEMPKKPYRLNLDSKQPLLGFNSSGNYILLANYDDKTMLRNDVSLKMSEMFGMFWTPNNAFVEVYLNGQYEGVYELAEKVEVSKAHLNIGSMDNTDISGTNLTGGYLGEIDHYYDETFKFIDLVGLPIGLDDPDPPADIQAAYFKQKFMSAEESMYGPGWQDPNTGWQMYWDKNSLVNYFLVEELAENQDADDFSSDYFYKPRGDDRFYRGPVWDMDLTFGNVNYSSSADPSVPWVSTQAQWYAQLFKDPNFSQAVKDRWATMRPQVATLSAYIDSEAANLSVAQQNNFGRWPILGERVWPNTEAAGSYSGEVTVMKNWLAARLTYMDSQYLSK